jgi:hypothetical protein
MTDQFSRTWIEAGRTPGPLMIQNGLTKYRERSAAPLHPLLMAVGGIRGCYLRRKMGPRSCNILEWDGPITLFMHTGNSRGKDKHGYAMN